MSSLGVKIAFSFSQDASTISTDNSKVYPVNKAFEIFHF